MARWVWRNARYVRYWQLIVTRHSSRPEWGHNIQSLRSRRVKLHHGTVPDLCPQRALEEHIFYSAGAFVK